MTTLLVSTSTDQISLSITSPLPNDNLSQVILKFEFARDQSFHQEQDQERIPTFSPFSTLTCRSSILPTFSFSPNSPPKSRIQVERQRPGDTGNSDPPITLNRFQTFSIPYTSSPIQARMRANEFLDLATPCMAHTPWTDET